MLKNDEVLELPEEPEEVDWQEMIGDAAAELEFGHEVGIFALSQIDLPKNGVFIQLLSTIFWISEALWLEICSSPNPLKTDMLLMALVNQTLVQRIANLVDNYSRLIQRPTEQKKIPKNALECYLVNHCFALLVVEFAKGTLDLTDDDVKTMAWCQDFFLSRLEKAKNSALELSKSMPDAFIFKDGVSAQAAQVAKEKVNETAHLIISNFAEGFASALKLNQLF